MSSTDKHAQLLAQYKRLNGKVAIVTGGSRGIGRVCCLSLAKAGCSVVIAAKTTEPHPTLPGTIYTVADEVVALGARALPIKVDLRNLDTVSACVAEVMSKFGRIDILINNASALWWQDIRDTPMKKYDLITSVNARGTFAMTSACLPHMEKNGWGRVITMSPPISLGHMAGHTAYNISKFGMTMVALGVAQEYKGKGITGNSLWPATIIESLASINFKMGERKFWRKASIIADATMGIILEDDEFTGIMCIDDKFLRARWGFEDTDFVRYRCDPDVEPPRFLDLDDESGGSGGSRIRRGDVRKLGQDLKRSTNDFGPSKL